MKQMAQGLWQISITHSVFLEWGDTENEILRLCWGLGRKTYYLSRATGVEIVVLCVCEILMQFVCPETGQIDSLQDHCPSTLLQLLMVF